MNQAKHNHVSPEGCAGREEDLLMYVHGALPPMARARTARHLRSCPPCRQRLAALTATSQALADTIRGRELPRWTPPKAAPAPFWFATGTMVVGLLFFTLIGVTLWGQRVQANTAPATDHATGGTGGYYCPSRDAEPEQPATPHGRARRAMSSASPSPLPTATPTPAPATPDRVSMTGGTGRCRFHQSVAVSQVSARNIP